MPLPADPAGRFSDRVEEYRLFRPRYPAAVAEDLRESCALPPDAVVADIGAGTGMLSERFLSLGCTLLAVEPNGEMRAACDRALGGNPRLRIVAGAAEATGLPGGCADLVVAGQAFHWFDRARARREFLRILKPGGWVALIWNDRDTDSTPFLHEYERLLLRYGNDYRQVDSLRPSRESLAVWFQPAEMQERAYRNLQHLDAAGMRGRLLSSSYVPASGLPGHLPMMARLDKIFRRYQEEGRVTLTYRTSVYFGRLAAGGTGAAG